MFSFKDNPKYKEVFESKVHGKKFYMPANLSDYHISRQIAANAQNIYSAAGGNKDVFGYLVDKILDLVNDEKDNKRLKSDIAIYCNNMKYRMSYPIDDECGIRMGAIYVFIEGEDPDNYSLAYTAQKELLAKGNIQQGIKPDPELYDFFLQVGIASTEAYKDLSEDLKDMEYLMNRKKVLESLMPQSTLSQK